MSNDYLYEQLGDLHDALVDTIELMASALDDVCTVLKAGVNYSEPVGEAFISLRETRDCLMEMFHELGGEEGR